MHEVEKYIDDVLTGTRPACLYERQAVQRYVSDLEIGEQRNIYFSRKHAQHVIDFFHNYLYHSKGSEFAGSKFILQPWQQFRLWNVFGWRKDSTEGARRFRVSYTEVPRKNGKTTEAAGVIIYTGFIEGESRAENYTAATKRDQARICFEEAQNMVRSSPVLNSFLKLSRQQIFDVKSQSKLEPLSSDKDTLDGLNIHCAIIDELHAHKTSEVVDVLRTATGARHQPLIYEITTAGVNRQGVCYNHRDYTTRVLSGEIVDDSWFGVIYTLDEGDDYRDPANWAKANPNLNVSRSYSYTEAEVRKATNDAANENVVKRYDFNMWVSSDDQWVSVDYFNKNTTTTLTDSELQGMTAYAGLDLASTRDFNSLAVIFYDDVTGLMHVKNWYWCPRHKIDDRMERQTTNFKKWVNQGLINETPGNVVSSDILAADVINICNTYNVQMVAYDRALAYSGTIQALISAGIPVNEQSQNIMAMSEPTKTLEKKMVDGSLTNDGNPVTAWQLGNVVIYRDANDNIKIVKNRSQDKVDGIVAQVMAMAELMSNRAIDSKQGTLDKVGFF